MRPAVCAMAAVSLPRTSALSGRSSRATLHADPAAVLPHWQEAVHTGSLLVHCCGNRTQLPRPLHSTAGMPVRATHVCCGAAYRHTWGPGGGTRRPFCPRTPATARSVRGARGAPRGDGAECDRLVTSWREASNSRHGWFCRFEAEALLGVQHTTALAHSHATNPAMLHSEQDNSPGGHTAALRILASGRVGERPAGHAAADGQDDQRLPIHYLPNAHCTTGKGTVGLRDERHAAHAWKHTHARLLVCAMNRRHTS